VDLAFAGQGREAQQELLGLRNYLKTADGLPENLNIFKFIAKGTQGWVFGGEWKDTGLQVAVKVIRMTQSLGGVKEWYVSKLLKNAGIEKVVFTEPTVYVITRGDERCNPVIEEQLRDAGPIKHYVCLVQELMNGGTLERFFEDRSFVPKQLFSALHDVASTLEMMHTQNVQHRDVKPENVLIQMEGGDVVAAKLCDLGSAEIGNIPENRADDVRRFGVTLFSLVTGEGWTKMRLIHEKHENLIARLTEAVASSDSRQVRRLPKVLKEILSDRITMSRVSALMAELVASC
jgi:serine/threonine protein kinase